jgi:hypothetical protein
MAGDPSKRACAMFAAPLEEVAFPERTSMLVWATRSVPQDEKRQDDDCERSNLGVFMRRQVAMAVDGRGMLPNKPDIEAVGISAAALFPRRSKRS